MKFQTSNHLLKPKQQAAPFSVLPQLDQSTVACHGNDRPTQHNRSMMQKLSSELRANTQIDIMNS